MTKIFLIRHGQTEWNLAGKYQGQSNVQLSARGVEQARMLAAAFPARQLDAIYASDLSRAMTTARMIAERFRLPVQPEKAFREMNFGDWEGLTYAEIAAKWPDIANDFFRRPDRLLVPHGETFAILQERAVARVEELCAAHAGQTIAVFAHGAVLRTILAAALHMPLRYIWHIRQDNTAVNIVRYDEDGALIDLLNSTAHLGGERPESQI